METQKTFNIRKRIAKHGSNSIIVIPKLLQSELSPSTIVDIEIRVVRGAENNFMKSVETELKTQIKNEIVGRK